MSRTTSGRVIVVTFDAYSTSTRARKSALTYGHHSDVIFLGMSAAGRTGRWGTPGWDSEGGVNIYLVPMREPSTRPSRVNVVKNVLGTYLPALLRMAAMLWVTKADVVHVVGAPLCVLGLVHRMRHRSRIVLDVQERPGAVAAAGSATALFARTETVVLAVARRFVSMVTVVTEPDVRAMESLGFDRVRLVRNAPLDNWRAAYRDTSSGTPVFVAIGSIFEGRGYEILLAAAARASMEAEFRIRLFGPGRKDYLDGLKKLTTDLGLDQIVEWRGRIPQAEVSEAYLDAHVGLVLYESDDPGNDGLSNKILECVASGRPVLAGRLPENDRFVTRHKTGWLTEMSEDGLAEALVRVTQNLQTISGLGRHCRTLGDTELVWEREFAGVLDQVLLIKDGQRAARR